MADRFVNGLKLTAPASAQCGRTFSRWLVEWLTQVCGWTVVDEVSGNWTNVIASGAAGESVSSLPNQFDIGSGYSFTSADIGRYLTITGFSGRFASRNGIYYIRRIISSTAVELAMEESVHEDGFPPGIPGLSWRLWSSEASYVPTAADVIVLGGTGTTGSGYTFHLHINVRSTNSYFPEFRISPFGSWSAGSHSWSDLRYTSALGIDNWNNSLISTDVCRVWAVGDSDRAVIMIRTEDNYYAWHMIYLGEIDSFFPTDDPKPCILWAGSNRGQTTPAADNITLVGYGADSNINGRGLWLSYDELTSVTGYLAFPHSPYSSDGNWVSEEYRRFGQGSRSNFLLPLACECRTSGFMEIRGLLRRFWVTGRNHLRETPFGEYSAYLHVIGGLTFPWINTKTWYQR
jgi:hypothetical protein